MWPGRITAVALAAAILGPLALPGYVLSYDMVFVPTQRLSWHLIAPADALPRAVPLDAAVALANLVIPGWLLQRFALAGIVVFAALGAFRLVPTERTAIRVVAAVGYVWTPYLAERLLIGHWALLCAYAALPWLVLASIDLRRGSRGALARLVVAAAAGCLTPTGGVLTMVTVVALLWRAVPRRTAAWATGSVVLLNLPWLVASVVSAAGGRSDPAGIEAFSARAENWGGVLVSLAGTGGIWNRLTTPESRSWALVPVVTVLVLALAVVGYPALRARLPAGVAARLAWLGLGGFVLALAGTIEPGAAALRFLVANVPGAGMLRDGQKVLIPYVLLLVLCAACGAERVAARLGAEPGRVVVAGALIAPLLAMPDLAWGGAGALRPVAYPADWAAVNRLIAADQGSDSGSGSGSGSGEVLPLPFAEYRRYAWNYGRVVIDPAPRYLDAPVVTDDALLVDGKIISGEGQRAADIRARLATGVPAADIGPTWVLVQGPGVAAATLAGLEPVYQGTTLALYRNPSPAPPPVSDVRKRIAVLTGHLLALAVLLIALGARIHHSVCEVLAARRVDS